MFAFFMGKERQMILEKRKRSEGWGTNLELMLIIFA